MKKITYTLIFTALMAFIAQAETLIWTGAWSDALEYGPNWSPAVNPGRGDDCIVDNTNGFRQGWIATVGSGIMAFDSLNFSAAGGWPENAGRLSIRSRDVNDSLSGDLIFSGDSLTDEITLQGTSTSSLGFDGASIINDTTAILKFGETNGFEFCNDGAQTLTFEGSGDIELGPTVTFPTDIYGRRYGRLYTASNYTGTLTIRDGAQVILNPESIDHGLRCNGGTLKIEGTNTVDDAVVLVFGGAGGAEVDMSGLSDTMARLDNFSTGTVTLRVDGDTDVIFEDFRIGTNAVNINIVGWQEGQSSLVFTRLGDFHYADKYVTNWFGVYLDPGSAGPISNNAVFNYLTINGEDAYMVEYDDGTVTGYAVSNGDGLGSKFSDWASARGLDGSPDADNDSDGLSDYQKYALNGNPKDGLGTVPVSSDFQGTDFVYVYAARNDDDSIVYNLIDTPDLVSGPFGTNNYKSMVVGSVVATNYSWVTNIYDTTGTDTGFIKLIVE